MMAKHGPQRVMSLPPIFQMTENTKISMRQLIDLRNAGDLKLSDFCKTTGACHCGIPQTIPR